MRGGGTPDANGHVLAQLQPLRKLWRSDACDPRQGRSPARRHARRSDRTGHRFPRREGCREKPVKRDQPSGRFRMKITKGYRWIGSAAVVASLLLGLLPWRANTQSEFMRGDRMPYDAFDKLAKTDLDVPGGVVHVGFAPGEIALPKEKILDWVRTSARAVATYYGLFSVPCVRR